MTAMAADRLLVVHHDDSQTRYEQVRYRPGRDSVRVVDADGREIEHEDVLRVHAEWDAR